MGCKMSWSHNFVYIYSHTSWLQSEHVYHFSYFTNRWYFRCNFQAKYFWTWEEEFCTSKWPCSIYYINTYEISNHFTITLIFFNCKREIYDVAIATVIFTHVKITCYLHVWRYHVLMWKLTWYFIGGYITNK